MPEFVTAGMWRQYVDGRPHAWCTLPLPDSHYPDPLRWSAPDTGWRCAMPARLLPARTRPGHPSPDDRTLLHPACAADQRLDRRDPADRHRPADHRRGRAGWRVADLRYWRAGVVVWRRRSSATRCAGR